MVACINKNLLEIALDKTKMIGTDCDPLRPIRDIECDENKIKGKNNVQKTYGNKNFVGTDYNYKHKIVWLNVIAFLALHILAVFGLMLVLLGQTKFLTCIWGILIINIGIVGVTVGAHRYYTHRCFKAKPILRAIFLLIHTFAGQNSMLIWCRDHRLHHRYSDTDADPHNAKRGFFFSHIGWLITRKHPLVAQLGRQIDLSDLQADWMVMFQKKYYYPLYFVLAFLGPVAVPVYLFDESWIVSICVCYFLRYAVLLNGTWLVNSAAHLYGTRPYDENLQSVETWFVSLISLGEGWHNYHHAFPWDYKAAELSMHFNASADVIRFLEYLGLAWDLKTASPEKVEKRIFRTGDGTHYKFGIKDKCMVTAVGIVHPLNPSFTTIRNISATGLKPEGLPLFHERDVTDINQINEPMTS